MPWRALPALALALSCDCPDSKPAAVGTPQAKVATKAPGVTLTAVVVTPASASLVAGGTLQLQAAGSFSDGTTAVVPVIWTTTGGGSVSATGLYGAGASAGTDLVIATAQGATLADTATITVPPPPSAGDVVVAVAGVAAGGTTWLLRDTDITTPGAAGCPSDLVTTFAGTTVSLGTPTSSCATELSAFATGLAPVLDPSPTPVVLGAQKVVSLALPTPWQVKLRVIAEYPEAVADVVTEAGLVNQLFNDNRMGIVVEVDQPVQMNDPTSGTATTAVLALASAIRGLCVAVGTTPELDSPDHLTVVYVRDSEWPPGNSDYGINCVDKGFPGTIFLREKHADLTLVHEIGHGFSLRHIAPGSLMLTKGWSDDNVMQGSAFAPGGTEQITAFTLGQVYRANFNAVSWLNLNGVRSAPNKNCQPTDPLDGMDAVTWPCPLLQLDW